MNYELAKQLKEAGYTDKKDGKLDGQSIKSNGTIFDNFYESDVNSIHCPELPELIEACGERFRYIRKIIDGRDRSVSWRAKGKETEVTKLKSPEEAVAKLWLKLNNK